MIEGCVHIHMKDGEIKNVFCHLSNIPINGVIHMKPEQILTEDEFKVSHHQDRKELTIDRDGEIYNLGPNSI